MCMLNILLLTLTLAVLQGIVQSLKDGFGFIDCVEREGRIFFHFSELIDSDWDIRVQDEVEFTVVPVCTADERFVFMCREYYLVM